MPFAFCVDFDWRGASAPCDIGKLRKKIGRALAQTTAIETLPNAALRIFLFSDDPLAPWQMIAAETTLISALRDAAVLNGGHVAEMHCCNARSGILPERLECIVDVSYP